MNFTVDLSQYEIIREIGRTSYSTTYAARCVNNNEVVSIKKIDLDNHPLSMNFLKGEMGFWSEMSFPNMIKYYGSAIDKNILNIFTEYANHGPLLDILKFQYPNGINDELLISSILREILIFLVSFHNSYHIHRSLETRNIFVGQNGNIQIGGFWRARSLIQDGKLQNSRNSSIESSCYTAPELIVDNSSYHQSVDIWSLGIIAYELAIGKAPYSDNENLYQIKSIIDNPPPSLPLQKVSSSPIKTSNVSKNNPKIRKSYSIDSSANFNFSSSFRNFIYMCLQKDPKKRPSASELLNHKFIIQAKGVDYIYANMVMQLPQLYLRFSLNNDDNKNHIENMRIENKAKINFNFCGLDGELEEGRNNPGMHSDDNSNDTLNSSQLDSSTPSIAKSRSYSTIHSTNSNRKSIQVMKKGRFTISIPIS